MRTLTNIAAEVSNNNKILSMEVESVPFGQRPAIHVAKIQASQKLPVLLEEIKSVVIPSRLVGLFATGDLTAINDTINVLTFSKDKEGKTNGGIFLDVAQLYRSIVDLVEPSYGRDRTFSSLQYSIVIRKISEIGINLGYQEINPPKFASQICPDTASTMSHVRKMLRDCKVGDQANLDLLTNKVIDAIVRDKIDSKHIPVIVTEVNSQDEKNAIATLFSRIVDYKFPTGFIATSKTVAQLFREPKEEEI